jgi:drug/metabolite transporter (DMT)-like permease
MIGLKSTNTSTTALLENTAIVFVPLFEGVLRRRFPKTPTMLSALLALSGVALITLKGGNFKLTTGEIACLVAAIFYASAIILTDRLSRKNDTLVLGIFQIGFLGLFASIAAFLIEQPHLPNSNVEWGSILILAFVCTSFGFTLQPFAQSHTTSERASVFCALNPVFTSILGVIFLHENLGFLGTLGALLVLSSIFLPHLLQFKFKPGG